MRLASILFAGFAGFAGAAAACGSGGAGSGGGGHGTGPGPARVDAGAAPAVVPLTAHECDELITHAVALAGAERGSGSPMATAAELDQVTTSLRTDLGARCTSLPRAAYACALAAKTLAELSACE